LSNKIGSHLTGIKLIKIFNLLQNILEPALMQAYKKRRLSSGNFSNHAAVQFLDDVYYPSNYHDVHLPNDQIYQETENDLNNSDSTKKVIYDIN
jgi:hypothetical protein